MGRVKQAWVVRAHPHHVNRISEFLQRELVALGWPNLGSLAGKDVDGIKAILRKVYGTRDTGELGRSAGALDMFVNRIDEGDFVLVPSPEDGAVYVGEFRGPYRYSKANEKDNYPHQRRVTWLLARTRIPRSELPPVLVRSLRAHQPIFSTDADALGGLVTSRELPRSPRAATEEVDTDGAMVRLEGDVVRTSTLRVTRDAALRNAKIEQARKASGGRLICEVPGCGFDFESVYGVTGKGFAHVHHVEQLSSRKGRRQTSLDQLKIVCANCHAMIHRYGECRDIEGLICK